MCKVLNKRVSSAGVYIGRGSAFGNPFVIGKDGSRDEVIRKYIELYSDNSDFIAKVRRELRGKDLVCFCSPALCHGDWLLEIANR